MQNETDEDVAIKLRAEMIDLLKFKLRDRDDAGKMLSIHYLEQKLWKWFKKLHRRNHKAKAYPVQSRMVAHALHEFSLLPKEENPADQDLREWLQAGVLDLIFVLSKQGHSGGTMHETLDLFIRLASQQALSPITNSPDEWEDVSDVSGYPFWQNKRSSGLFSRDSGNTYFDANGADPTLTLTSHDVHPKMD